jgi:hypothetical protein
MLMCERDTLFTPPPPQRDTLQRHYTENSKQIFPERKLRGLFPNSYIHVSVSDLEAIYIFPDHALANGDDTKVRKFSEVFCKI